MSLRGGDRREPRVLMETVAVRRIARRGRPGQRRLASVLPSAGKRHGTPDVGEARMRVAPDWGQGRRGRLPRRHVRNGNPPAPWLASDREPAAIADVPTDRDWPAALVPEVRGGGPGCVARPRRWSSRDLRDRSSELQRARNPHLAWRPASGGCRRLRSPSSEPVPTRPRSSHTPVASKAATASTARRSGSRCVARRPHGPTRSNNAARRRRLKQRWSVEVSYGGG